MALSGRDSASFGLALELGSTPDAVPHEPTEWPRYFAGPPQRVRARLIQMANELQVDELMPVTVVHEHQARLHSYELLAEAFELTPRF